jgi:ribonuclease D
LKQFINDIPDNELNWITTNCTYIAIDSETTGLDPKTDDLCLIQIAAHNKFFLIRFTDKPKLAPNLSKLLANKDITKIFHNANFDLRFFMQHLDCLEVKNVVCTKISGKLLNGIEEFSSLKNLLKKYIGIELDKSQQTSKWNNETLTNEQIEYAVNDVRYLCELWKILREKLNIDGKTELAQRCFDFLPTQAYLENLGLPNIFQY